MTCLFFQIISICWLLCSKRVTLILLNGVCFSIILIKILGFVMCLHFHCLKGILCYNPNFKISKNTFTQQRICVSARVVPFISPGGHGREPPCIPLAAGNRRSYIPTEGRSSEYLLPKMTNPPVGVHELQQVSKLRDFRHTFQDTKVS